VPLLEAGLSAHVVLRAIDGVGESSIVHCVGAVERRTRVARVVDAWLFCRCCCRGRCSSSSCCFLRRFRSRRWLSCRRAWTWLLTMRVREEDAVQRPRIEECCRGACATEVAGRRAFDVLGAVVGVAEFHASWDEFALSRDIDAGVEYRNRLRCRR